MLLVIDTSGSMENMADGKRPENAGATCVPGTATPLNRWATLVTVLTEHSPPAVPVQIVYPQSRLLAPKVRAFIDFAAPRLAKLIA